jgi:hypothetical protein
VSEEASLLYRLDQQDRIVDVSNAWDETASAYEADKVLRRSVEGTKLYSHISGETTRLFMWTLLDATRKLQRPSTRPYRCDTPDCKRFMEMTVLPEAGGRLTVAHRLLRTEPIVTPTPARSRVKTLTGLMICCSMCNAVRLKGQWLPASAAAAMSQTLSASGETLDVAYGVCDDCRMIAHQPPSLR